MANSKGNFALGLLLGGLAGAAIAYLSDRSKRERLVDNVSSAVDRTKDSLVEGYYEAKDKYRAYRNRLASNTNDILDEIEDELERVSED